MRNVVVAGGSNKLLLQLLGLAKWLLLNGGRRRVQFMDYGLSVRPPSAFAAVVRGESHRDIIISPSFYVASLSDELQGRKRELLGQRISEASDKMSIFQRLRLSILQASTCPQLYRASSCTQGVPYLPSFPRILQKKVLF